MTYRPVIRTQADLEATWRFLLQPLGFGSESLWFMLLEDDGTVLPSLTQIEQATEPPDDDEALALALHLHSLVDDLGVCGGRVAFVRSRPGSGGPTERDRAWARALAAGCRLVGLPCETVHLATDDDVVPLSWDDLVTSPA